ncbi:2Fe-2S iron-sulfur cluster binding domain-containing protein [Pseudactinotalea sp. HY160]|uniref:xanthine dehydrogenase small subunit n=1 Tax=Pseudactinotalea sp. HY160 TaxID=2654490 RepID=UPI00128BDD93|nr:FAD binding domain-containing protein [Pseudactinotalea sp. HY160]MPV48707.1 2Fe-2S iron-sulfur cluster binding domain-containing protein [Pseudactinotalea sp. HY160]
MTEIVDRPGGNPGAPGSSPEPVTVNGRPLPLGGVAPHTTTLQWLRANGVTGPKEGCAEGECGACSVMVSRPDGRGGTRWTAVNSCLIPAAALAGQEIYSAEGLATADALHPVQEEMALRGGSQCGYCTPGFVSSMAAEYYREDRSPCGQGSGCCSAPATSDIVSSARIEPSGNELPWSIVMDDAARPLEDWLPPRTEDITEAVVEPATRYEAAPGHDAEIGPNGFDLHALSGNLCRCTGYRPIRDAAFALGGVDPDDPIAQRRSRPAPVSAPTRIDVGGTAFVRPADLAEAVELLAAQPDSVLLAGSTDWGVELTIKHRRAPLTIAIDQLPELRTFAAADGHIEIGAGLTLSEVERQLRGSVPLLAQLFPLFASQLIRNAATIGGNLGTGSPIGDLAPALLALDAELVLTSTRGDRTVPLAGYFTGYRQSVRAADELIRAVRIPTPIAPLGRFYKVAKRKFDDISSVAVAIAATLTDGVVSHVRIGVGGAAATPLRAEAAEAELAGRPWSRESFDAAADIMNSVGTPMSDHRASAAYRSATLAQSIRRFYAEVAS